MKLNELYMDNVNLRQQPENDFHPKHFVGDENRKPVVTLRHINKLKKMKQAMRDEHAERKKLLGIMYVHPSEEGQ